MNQLRDDPEPMIDTTGPAEPVSRVPEVPGMEEIASPRNGRPTVLHQLNLTIEQVVECYKNSASQNEAAAKLGFTKRTLRKYLHEAGVWPGQTKMIRGIGVSFKPSAVYHWIRTQKGIIPRSVREIAELSRLNEAAVRKFLTRRRYAASQHLSSLGLLRDLENVQLVTTRGAKITTQQIGQSKITVDLYDLSVEISALLRSGVTVRCRLSFNEYCRVFAEHKRRDVEDPLATKSTDPRSANPST